MTSTTYFKAKAEAVGGFGVFADWLNGDIEVRFVSGRGLRHIEQFTAADSAIHDKAMLQSYCEARLAQWRRLQWQRVA